jgi:hypothetical protein
MRCEAASGYSSSLCVTLARDRRLRRARCPRCSCCRPTRGTRRRRRRRSVRKLGRAESEGFRNGSALWAREPPATIVAGRETSEAGRPIPISGPSDSRLDPPEAAAGHRVAASREPAAARTPRHRALAVHRRRAPAPGEKGRGLGRTMLAELGTLATPETILRWYRRMIAAKYDGSETRRSPGRPPTASDVTTQLPTMARESPLGATLAWAERCATSASTWLAPRSSPSCGTTHRTGPRRRKTLSWSVFLQAPWGAIAAADFFSVDVLTVDGLVRYFVLFVIDLRLVAFRSPASRTVPTGHGWRRSLATSRMRQAAS